MAIHFPTTPSFPVNTSKVVMKSGAAYVEYSGVPPYYDHLSSGLVAVEDSLMEPDYGTFTSSLAFSSTTSGFLFSGPGTLNEVVLVNRGGVTVNVGVNNKDYPASQAFPLASGESLHLTEPILNVFYHATSGGILAVVGPHDHNRNTI